MRRIVLLLSILAVVAAGGLPAIAADDGKVKRFAQSETLGFYRGSTVAYLDFGPVKLSAGNKVAPIWAFANGAGGQRNIIDTVPGRSDYTPLWAVRLVTWKNGQTARVLRSAAAVRRAAGGGPGVDQGHAHRRQLPRSVGGSSGTVLVAGARWRS